MNNRPTVSKSDGRESSLVVCKSLFETFSERHGIFETVSVCSFFWAKSLDSKNCLTYKLRNSICRLQLFCQHSGIQKDRKSLIQDEATLTSKA